MDNAINKELLNQRWIRDHEESTETEVVYRPAGYKRSRAQTGFELKPDQTAINISTGANDVPQQTTGSWEIKEDDSPTLQILLETGETQKLPIISVEKNKLVVRNEDS